MRFLLLVLLGLVVVGGGVGYYYWQNNPRFRVKVVEIVGGEQVKQNNSPDELRDQYDPTVTRGVYSIGQSDQGQKTIVLTLVWPKIERVVSVISRLECEGGLRLIGKGKEKTITVEEFWGDQRVQEAAVLVSGLCGDKTCKSLISECEVNVGGDAL